MSRGKKTSPETIYKVMVSWAATKNYKETAELLGMAVSSVKKLVEENKDKPKYVKLCKEKEGEFADRATAIINKGLILLNRRMDRAINNELELDILIDEIFDTEKEKLSQDEKNKLVAKIRILQIQDIKAITTALGTLYDKRALAKGEFTNKTEVEIKLPKEVEELGC